MKALFLLWALLCCAGTATVLAQPIPKNIKPRPGYTGPVSGFTIVRLDPFSRIPIGDIPFDREFIVRIYFNDPGEYPNRLYILETNSTKVSGGNLATGQIVKGSKVYADDKFLMDFCALDVYVPALKPGKKYDLYSVRYSEEVTRINFEIFKLINAGDTPGAHLLIRQKSAENEFYPSYEALVRYYEDHRLQDVFRSQPDSIAKAKIVALQRDSSLVTFVDAKGRRIRTNITSYGKAEAAIGAVQGKLETSAPFNLVADAGLVVAGFQKGFTSLVPYAGIAYSFRAFDSDVPFKKIPHLKFYERVTLNAGITVNSIAKDKYRSNLFGSNNLVLGLGFKFSHAVSATAGGMLYNQLDPNPLLDKKNLSVVPYVGLSINLKIKAALGAVANAFNYGK